MMQKQRKQTIDSILDEIVSLNNQIVGLEVLIKNRKQKVKEYFSETGESKIKHNDVQAYVTTKTFVTYDISALKQKLDKSLYSQFIDKEYTINVKEFKKVLARLNLKFSLFKDAILVKESVNEAKLNSLYDNSIISIKDLEGCYDANASKIVNFRFYKQKDPVLNVKSDE